MTVALPEPPVVSFLSICSGIEAASVALEPLGFAPVAFAETDRDASAVLTHRFGSNMPGEPPARNGVPNLGDFTGIDVHALPRVEWLIGGTPCQAFSIAGNRLSLADARGNLTLAYAVLAHELARSNGLEGALWENVPGVLSTRDNAFGCFLGGLVGGDAPVEPVAKPRRGKSNRFWRWRDAGTDLDDDGNEIAVEEGHYTRWPSVGMVAGPLGRAAWRIFDAQYFGLAQRRRRVFVIAGFGARTDPAAILFERKGVFRDSPPSREAGKDIAGTVEASLGRRCGQPNDHDPAGGLIPAYLGKTVNNQTPLVGQPFAFKPSHFTRDKDGAPNGVSPPLSADADKGDQDPLVCAPIAFSAKGDPCHPLAACAHPPAVAFDLRGREEGARFEGPHDTANIRAASGGSSRSYVAAEVVGPLSANGGTDRKHGFGMGQQDWESGYAVPVAGQQWAVRRLTPRECERLQGFDDDWTLTPNPRGQLQADGPRYKQLGNSMPVPVLRWIGRRILERRSL